VVAASIDRDSEAADSASGVFAANVSPLSRRVHRPVCVNGKTFRDHGVGRCRNRGCVSVCGLGGVGWLWALAAVVRRFRNGSGTIGDASGAVRVAQQRAG
jgi:hypothetical protein